jgi:cytochrome P450
VAVVFTSANRDGKVFENPDTYRLDRNNKELLSFGRGPHMCPGAPLARILLREVLRQLTTGTKTLALIGDIGMTRWPEYGPLRAVFRVC